MLKLISKIFLVSILSGSLLMIDFSYKGIMLNELRAERFKTDEIKDENMMASLTMTAIGLIASRLYKYKMTTDIMIAAGGGAAFIGGEIAAFSKNKEVVKGLDLEIERDKHGRVNENQRGMFEKHKKSYEKMKESANTKKMLQMAGAGAFAAAAAVAYTMASANTASMEMCSSGIVQALSLTSAVTPTCTALSANPNTKPQGVQCSMEVSRCTAAINTFQGNYMSHELARQATGPSAQGLATDMSTMATAQSSMTAANASCMGTYVHSSTAFTGVCSSLFSQETTIDSGGPAVMLSFKNKSLKNDREQKYLKLIEKFFTILIPTASADLFSPMGIASGLAIKFILASSATLSAQLDLFMLIPQKRAIIWGVLAGLAFAASTATGEEIAKIDENIKKIDDILSQMGAQEGIETTNVANSLPKEIGKSTGAKAYNNAIKFTSENGGVGEIEYPEKGGRFPCVTGPDSKNCPSYDATLKSLPDYQGLSDSVKADISSVSQMVEGLNGASKISGGTLTAAQQLANKANALRNNLALNQDNLQSQLNKNKNAMNLSNEANNLKSNLLAATKKNLDSNKMSAGQMVASMKGGAIDLGAIADSKKDKNSKKDINANLNIYTAGKEKSLSDDDWGAKKDNKNDSSDISSAGYTSSNGTGSSSSNDSGTIGIPPGTIDQYDMRKDIVKDKNASLFDVITRRYQQSGYSRLFKKLK